MCRKSCACFLKSGWEMADSDIQVMYEFDCDGKNVKVMRYFDRYTMEVGGKAVRWGPAGPHGQGIAVFLKVEHLRALVRWLAGNPGYLERGLKYKAGSDIKFRRKAVLKGLRLL